MSTQASSRGLRQPEIVKPKHDQGSGDAFRNHQRLVQWRTLTLLGLCAPDVTLQTRKRNWADVLGKTDQQESNRF